MDLQQYRLINADNEIDQVFNSWGNLLEALDEQYSFLDVADDSKTLVLVGMPGAWMSKSPYHVESALSSYRLESEEEYQGWKRHERSYSHANIA